MQDNDTDQGRSIELWNPVAAVLWSLLFGPIFGSWIHYKNWKALNNWQNTDRSFQWFLGSVAILIIEPIWYPVVGLIWFFKLGLPQILCVRNTLKNDYIKKPWLKPSICFGVVGVLVGTLLINWHPFDYLPVRSNLAYSASIPIAIVLLVADFIYGWIVTCRRVKEFKAGDFEADEHIVGSSPFVLFDNKNKEMALCYRSGINRISFSSIVSQKTYRTGGGSMYSPMKKTLQYTLDDSTIIKIRIPLNAKDRADNLNMMQQNINRAKAESAARAQAQSEFDDDKERELKRRFKNTFSPSELSPGQTEKEYYKQWKKGK